MSYSIAIDGPAGAGKSTIAKNVAKQLEFIYVDTGAMFRAMGLYFIKNNISANDEISINKLCKDIEITIEYSDGEQQVVLNGSNVNDYIRTEEVGKMASVIAINKEVRLKLLSLQRKLAETSNVIMDGRDIGTCVLPNAEIKIYLTATSKERASRRFIELTQKHITCDIDQIEKDIIKRDNQDMNREIAPLKQASDAILIDSSNMTINEVIDSIKDIYYKKSKNK